MPINEQKVILNLKNNTDNKLITAKDIPGINRIGLLPDGTTYFEYEPITIYGKQPDMIDNTIGIPTRGIRDKALNTLGLATAGVMSLPLITYAGETAAASAAPSIITNIGRFGWKVLNHPITQTIGTIDGFRNLFTGNGVQKTYNHFKNEEYGRGTLSLAGDILDASPLLAIGKGLKYGKLVGNKLGFNAGIREFIDHLPGGKLLTEGTSSSDPFYNGRDLRKRISSTLYDSYDRERYIDTKLSTGPALVLTDPKYGDILIHGDPAVTGLTNIKRGGISSNMSSFPSFQNGNLVPAKGEIKFRNGSSLDYHPIFFSANTPFFETARGNFNSDYKDLREMLSNPRLKGVKQNIELNWLKGDTTYPYRFIETKYTPDLDVKGHFLIGGQGETHVMSVPMDEIIGHEYNPLFKTWELHRYVDPNMPRDMEDSNIIKYIHF